MFSEINPLIPCYHVVSDEKLPHVRFLYDYKNVNQFIRDIEWLASHFNPISMKDLLEHLRHGKKIGKRSIIITFDDGYRETYSVIAPILYRKGLPAIFFICSDLIDNKKLYYRNKASLLVEFIIRKERVVQEISSSLKHLQNLSTEQIIDYILGIRYRGQCDLDDMAEKVGLDFSDFMKTQQPYLTKTQIFSMIKMGFYFGGHSRDHADYRELDLIEQIDQTLESVDFARNNFDLEYSLFAFPFGDKDIGLEFFKSIECHVDLTFGTHGILKDVVPWNAQRIYFESGMLSASRIYKKQLIRKIYYRTKGKGTIKRK